MIEQQQQTRNTFCKPRILWMFNERTERLTKDMTVYVRGCCDLDL